MVFHSTRHTNPPPPQKKSCLRVKELKIYIRRRGGQSYFEKFLYIFMGFCVYVPLPPLRGQHMVLCHPRWLPTSGLTEFAVCWGGAGFEPRTTLKSNGNQALSAESLFKSNGDEALNDDPLKKK
jgi:hypothetical protein